MKKLLKAYGFNSDIQYFERIAFLFTNDKKASKLMFNDMPKEGKIKFINAALGSWQSGLNTSDLRFFVSSL